MARVLVIDDEPDVLMLCRVNLEHAGHEMEEAPDGESGLAMAKRTPPDIIVLDLMLPAMDGYDVLEALMEDEATRDVPVLVLTAKAQIEDRARSWRGGAAEFITKPFSPDLLLDALERLARETVDQRERHREKVIRELDQPQG